MYAAAAPSVDDAEHQHQPPSDDEEEEVEEEEEEEDVERLDDDDIDEEEDQEDDDDEEEEEEEDEEEEVAMDDDADAEPAEGDDGGGGEDGEGEGGAGGSPSSSSLNLNIAAVANLSSLSHLREIGKEALCWQLSSAKPGNGVEQIRDASLDTYWQSDGTKQPHWIQVHFARRVAVSHVCLYLDYSLDESYTPKKICVQHGMTHQDLEAAVHPANTQIEFSEPVGWCIVPLSSPPDPLDDCQDDPLPTNDADNTELDMAQRSRLMVRTHLLRISILTMHQNGRDTHIRQVLLYGPRMVQESTYLPRMIQHAPLQLPATALSAPDENAFPSVEGGGKDAQQQHNDDDDDDDDLGNFMMQPFGTIR